MMAQSKRIYAAGGALILALAAVFVLWQAGLPQRPALTNVPNFEAQTLDDQYIKVDARLNRPLVINFWATWCAPCIIEMPYLESAYQDASNQNLLVLGINAGEAPDQVEQWIDANSISFPIVIDPYGELERQYQIDGYPTTFFVDNQGRVQEVVSGQLTREALRRGLAAIGINE